MTIILRILMAFLLAAAFGCGSDASNESDDSDTTDNTTGTSPSTDDTDETDTEGGDTTTDTNNPGDTDTPDDTENNTDSDSEPLGFGCDITGGGTSTNFFTFQMTICAEPYNVQTNPWRRGTQQTVVAGGGNVFEITSLVPPEGATASDVASFPSVYLGTAHGGNPTPNSGLPARVGDLASVPTGLATNAFTPMFYGNSTYDVYFTNSETYTGGAPDVYLMVWLNSFYMNPITAEGYNCAADLPLYVSACTTAGSLMVNGHEFVRFIGTNGWRPVISYLPVEQVQKFEFDLNDFIKDAVNLDVLNDDMYLQGIQAGFELIRLREGDTTIVYDFYARVE